MNKKIILIIGVVLILLGVCLLGVGTHANDDIEPQNLTARKRTELEDAWASQTGDLNKLYDPRDPNSYTGFRYYGSYDGYDILFVEADTPAHSVIVIGDAEFEHSYGFQLIAYKDYQFVSLLEAYEEGEISDKSILMIASVHKEFQIAVYGEKWREYYDGKDN